MKFLIPIIALTSLLVFHYVSADAAVFDFLATKKDTTEFTFGETIYRVTRQPEHQPHIKTLIVEYRCAESQDWKPHHYKFGYCEIENVVFNQKRSLLYVSVINDPHFLLDNLPCNLKTRGRSEIKLVDQCGLAK